MINKLEHIALILDGNKRWAKKNNFSILQGYTKGFENINNIVRYSLHSNISDITIFALSSENFKRSSIKTIYEIIYNNFSKIFDELVKNNGVKIKIFGSREELPEKIQEIFKKIENLSSSNNSLNLNIAFNYGFKNEIKRILKEIYNNDKIIDYNEDKEINKLFDIGSSTDPDLLIRTGGHQRLSNFIMFNLTYTELFFTDTLWPDFSEKEFKSIIKKYSNINRKYGL